MKDRSDDPSHHDRTLFTTELHLAQPLLNGRMYAINNFQTCVPFRRDFGVCFIDKPVAPVPVINLECVADQANILLYCPSNRLIKTDLYISDDKRRDFIAWSTDEDRLGMISYFRGCRQQVVFISFVRALNPLSYFSFQPVLHDWCNKGWWYVLSCLWDGAYKRTIAVNRKE